MKKAILVMSLAFGYMLLSCTSDSTPEMQEEMESNPPPAAKTSIPDPAFENALIELGIDDEVDGEVLTNSIIEIQDLVIENKGISDLTGISDFTALIGLWVSDNDLISLDVSENSNLKFVFADNNQLNELRVNDLLELEKISTINNSLVALDLSDNLELQELRLVNNELDSLDISLISPVIQLNIFQVENNPLNCIKVNMEQLENIPSQWTKDPEDEYALNCN